MCHVINNTIHFKDLILSYLNLYFISNTFQLIDGTPVNIIMVFKCQSLVLLKTLQCVPNVNSWCFCRHCNVYPMLLFKVAANITMCAKCLFLVLLQTL